MKVVLKKLELSNFRNISHAEYVFDGNSKIVGENRIGKTNTLEAIYWLLSDKLLNGSSDIAAIKPLSDTRLEVRVEGTFDVDGKEIVLRKEYGEDWVKTRGTDDLVFKGHYLTYWYNGVKQKAKKDFIALFQEDFKLKGFDFKNIDFVQMLINPFYIGEMGESDTWKDLRAFIISLVGDISDADVFAKEPILQPLQSDLNIRGGRIDEVKKYYQNEINSLEEQIIGSDAQIKLLEETPSPSEQELAVAKKGIQDIDEQITNLQNGLASDAPIVEIDKEINEINKRIISLQLEDREKNSNSDLNQKLAALNNKYREQLTRKASLKDKISTKERDMEYTKNEVLQCDLKRGSYISKIRELDAKLNEPFVAECPTCHRPLEGEELKKAQNDYFAEISKERDEIYSLGKKNKADKEAKEILITNLKQDIDFATLELNSLESSIKDTLKEIDDISKVLNAKESEPVEANPMIATLEKQIEELNSKKRIISVDTAALNAHIREKVEEKTHEKEQFQKVINDFEYYQRQVNQLNSVKEIKKEYESKLAKTEQKKELTNLFIKVKLEMLDENVSRVFGNIKFQLIRENINGGYDPICKPYIFNVDKEESTTVSWKSGSKSERVVTGIQICEKIKAALGLADLPFLFDEGGEISTETFNSKFKTDSQLICVKVVDNITTPMVMKI